MMMIFVMTGLISAFTAATAAYLAGKGFFMIMFAYASGGALGGLLALLAIFALHQLLAGNSTDLADDHAQTA